MGNPIFRARLAAGAVERELAPGDYTVGRSAENNIQLDDLSVSRRHARIVVEDGAIFVEDLGSSGAMANGRRLPAAHASCAEGDTLRFGDVEAELAPPAPVTPDEAVEESSAAAVPEVPPLPVAAEAAAAAAAVGTLHELSGDAVEVATTPNGHGNGSTEVEPPVPLQPDEGVLATAPGDAVAAEAESAIEPLPTEISTSVGEAEALEPAPVTDGAVEPEPETGPEPVEESPVLASGLGVAPPLPPLPLIGAAPGFGEPATFEPATPTTFEAAPLPPEPVPVAPAPPPSRLRMALALSQPAVDPGQPTTVSASLTNRGTLVEEVALSVSDIPAEWDDHPETLPLMPNAQAQATIVIQPAEELGRWHGLRIHGHRPLRRHRPGQSAWNLHAEALRRRRRVARARPGPPGFPR
jgi:pSer/pThr/pTyr-binding forkhead associated (FHA) protein